MAADIEITCHSLILYVVDGVKKLFLTIVFPYWKSTVSSAHRPTRTLQIVTSGWPRECSLNYTVPY